MKKSLFILIATLAVSLGLAACGKDNPNNQQSMLTPAPGAYNYSALPQATNTTIPLGWYWNGYGYSSCPTGYVQSGNSCVLNSNGGNVVCPSGQSWNGTSCVPQGFTCPNGGQFSYQYGGCVTQTCAPQDILWGMGTMYVCKYTTGAPTCQNGKTAYYNGYGWVCPN